jgi:hypothetical protein
MPEMNLELDKLEQRFNSSCYLAMLGILGTVSVPHAEWGGSMHVKIFGGVSIATKIFDQWKTPPHLSSVVLTFPDLKAQEVSLQRKSSQSAERHQGLPI